MTRAPRQLTTRYIRAIANALGLAVWQVEVIPTQSSRTIYELESSPPTEGRRKHERQYLSANPAIRAYARAEQSHQGADALARALIAQALAYCTANEVRR